MSLSLRGSVNIPEVDNSAWLSGLFPHDMHAATPSCWSIARHALENTEGDVSVQVKLGSLHPMGWNRCWFMNCLGLGVFLEEEP